MKKLLSCAIVALFLGNMSLASAELGGTITKSSTEMKTYMTAEAFLEAEGNTCETATDGCNTISIVEGEFEATTLRYCQEAKIYSCQKQREEPTMCTMQYAPVCWVDGVTYWNSCMAGKKAVAYEGECKSMIDASLYSALESNTSQITKINMVLEKMSDARLQLAINRADVLIANTRLLRISEKLQMDRTTKYTFIQDLIEAELERR